MALVIEDGTGSNPLAESYLDVAELRVYATKRDVDLTDKTNSECESLLIRAMDYLEAQGHKYKGYKTSATQPLQWPRADVRDVEQANALLPDDEIPRLIEYAQLSIAIEVFKSDLEKENGPKVIKEKVGPLVELTYSADEPKQNFVAAYSSSDALLAPLYERSGLAVVRG